MNNVYLLVIFLVFLSCNNNKINNFNKDKFKEAIIIVDSIDNESTYFSEKYDTITLLSEKEKLQHKMLDVIQ